MVRGCEGRDVQGPIFITKVEGRAPCEPPCCVKLRGHFEGVRTININNIKCLTIDQNMPVESTPLPEARDEGAIMVKAYGNHTTIQVTWEVVPEPCNVVRQTLVRSERLTGACSSNLGVPTDPCCACNGCTKLPDNITKYWLNIFQTNSIQDAYNIYIGDCFLTLDNMCAAVCNRIPNIIPTSLGDEGKFGFNTMCSNNYNCAIPWHKTGVLSNVRFTKSGATPVTYTGTLTFKVGDAVASPNECNS